jgi:hypothetical protein
VEPSGPVKACNGIAFLTTSECEMVCHSHCQLRQTDARLLASGNELDIIISVNLIDRKKWPKEPPFQTSCNVVYVLVFAHTFNEMTNYLRLATGWTVRGSNPSGARFSAPVQTGPATHSASCIVGTGSFPGVESGRGVTLTPHPLLVLRSKNRVAPYFCSP